MPKRNRIAFEHCERIVRAFEDVNEDYLIVADTLGVNRSTARRKTQPGNSSGKLLHSAVAASPTTK